MEEESYLSVEHYEKNPKSGSSELGLTPENAHRSVRRPWLSPSVANTAGVMHFCPSQAWAPAYDPACGLHDSQDWSSPAPKARTEIPAELAHT